MASFGPHQSAHDLVPAAFEKPSSLTPLSFLKHSWFRWLWLCITAPILLYWQFQLALQPQQLDHAYSNRAGVGVHREEAFVYFLYHLNLYPLATTLQEPEDSASEARRLIEQEADTLRTEVNHTARYGEHLKSHLLLLDALQKQSTRHPSYTFANGWAFRIALLALLVSFCWAGYPLLATALVVVLGSNPFQLHEIYARENVHGWVITTAIVLLALMVPVLKANRGRIYPWFAALLSALWLGSVVHIRSEPVVMLLAVAAAFLLMEKVPILQRLALVVVLFLGYGTVSTAWHDYFTWKIEQSTQVVQKAGGVPYQGPREFTHQFWHPLHVGLADFDQKYGFKWDDRWAARKLFPRLREQGVEIPPWDGTTYRFMDAWHDDGKRYYKALLLIPGFYELSKESYFAAIANDPWWYTKILLKRGWALLTDLTPLSLEAGSWRWQIPISGLWLGPVLWIMWREKNQFFFKLLLFTLPTCLPAFVMYAGRGMTFMAIYHLIAFMVLLTWLLGRLWEVFPTLAGHKKAELPAEPV